MKGICLLFCENTKNPKRINTHTKERVKSHTLHKLYILYCKH